MLTIKYFLKIGILYVAIFPFKKCTVKGEIHLCHEDADLTLYIPSIGSSKNISICLSTSKDKSDLTVQINHNSYVYHTSQDHMQFSFAKSSNYSTNFSFFIKTNSSNDYGAWTVTINELKGGQLKFTLMVVQEISSRIQFTFEKKQQSKEDEYKLICKGTNYPKSLEIKFVNGNIITFKKHNLQNYQRDLVLEVIKMDNLIQFIGSYVCTMTDYRNKNTTSTLHINDTMSDPKLCSEKSVLIKNTNENSNIKINICVVHQYKQVSVTLYDIESGDEIIDPRWSHVYKPITTIVGDIELTLHNVKESDFKMYKAVLVFTPNSNLTQYINITLKDHPTLLPIKSWMPKDICNKHFQRPLFRIVRSGLQLNRQIEKNNDTHISIMHKYGTVDYYVKIVFTNCTQYVNKNHVVNIKAGSSIVIPISFNLTEQSVNDVHLCNENADGLEYFVQLGQSFEIPICVNSSQVFNNCNIGINGIPAQNLSKTNNYLINIERKENYILMFQIQNIKTEDVKMYVVKIKNAKKSVIDLTFFLRLPEGPPVFCNATRPQTIFSVTIGQMLTIKHCLLSYQELSSDVVINDQIYNPSSSSGQIVVQIYFDETLLQYYIEIDIKNITYENMGLYNIRFKNKLNQVLEDFFFLNVTRELTTQIPKTTLPCRDKCIVTNHYNVTITKGGNGQQLTNKCTDDSLRFVVNSTCKGHDGSCFNKTKKVNCFVQHNNARDIVSLTILTHEEMNSSLHCNGRAINETNCYVCYTQYKENNSIVPHTIKLSFTNYPQDDVRICVLKLWYQSHQVLEMNITIHFKTDPDTSLSNTSTNIAVYIFVIAVTIVLVTSLFFTIFFLYRSRNARKYKVVTGTQHYANIFDTEKENLTDTIQESIGYTLNQDVILPHKDRKSDLSLNKSSFKKKGSGHLKYVHFESTSEGLGTDQSTDVTSLDSTIRQCSEESSSLASSGLCRHGPSEQCRCASVSSPLGRYVSKEGLIYLDLSNSDVSSIKSKASFWRSQASDINDKVEYAQLDFTLMKERERKKSKSKKGRKD